MEQKYISLYRKYRPKTFGEVVGQEQVTSTLSNQVKTGKINHAYLFTGSRGTGKTSCAKIFARAVNCPHAENGSPCNKCDVCRELLSNNNMDIVEIDAASNNSVEDIRLMRDNVKFAPTTSKYKVYIIDEVHMLSPSAFNALLKTLEEPPEHIIFILATTEVHKIPATIMSRVTRLDFRLVSQDDMRKHLKDVFSREGIACDDEGIAEIAKLSDGGVRDALSIAECVIGYKGDNITYDDVCACLGTTAKQDMYNLSRAMLDKDLSAFFACSNELYKRGKNFALLSKEIVSFFHDAIVCKTCDNANTILCLPEVDFANLSKFVEPYKYEDMYLIMDAYLTSENDFRYASSAKMLFESVAVLCMCDDEVKKKRMSQ